MTPSPAVYLVYFVWFALWYESVRFHVWQNEPPLPNPPRLGRVPEL